jgi:hypothetical protein
MSGFRIDLEGACAEHVSVRGGVVVGRDPAGGGEGSARRSRSPGRAAQRSGAVSADRCAVGAAAGRDWGLVGAGASDDRDGNVCAADDRQAPLGVGVRDVDAGGVGLDPSAAVLSDRDDRAGAGRVDGAQADTPARCGGGARDHARVDRQGAAGEAVPAAGGEDRLDRRGSGRALADGLRPRRGRRQSARPGGTQARRQGRGEADRRARSLAGDGSQAQVVDAHDPPPLGRGQARGARVDRADRTTARDLDQGGAHARRHRAQARAWPRRADETEGRSSVGGVRRPLREGLLARFVSGSPANRSRTG